MVHRVGNDKKRRNFDAQAMALLHSAPKTPKLTRKKFSDSCQRLAARRRGRGARLQSRNHDNDPTAPPSPPAWQGGELHSNSKRSFHSRKWREKEEPISFIPSAFFIPPAVVSRYLNCHLLSEVEQVERVNTVIGK